MESIKSGATSVEFCFRDDYIYNFLYVTDFMFWGICILFLFFYITDFMFLRYV